jgi:hypothetical protein
MESVSVWFCRYSRVKHLRLITCRRIDCTHVLVLEKQKGNYLKESTCVRPKERVEKKRRFMTLSRVRSVGDQA